MNSFKRLLPITVATLAVIIFVLGTLSVGLDWLQPRMPCTSFEKSYWNSSAPGQNFDMVSAYFWSSLCRAQVPPLIISASEGTGDPSFPSVINDLWHTQTDQFTGAHRGPKTIGYIFSNDIHPERLKGLRVLGMINPVYFSFGASTDSASIRLNAISNFSYVLRVHTFVQKWDEFLMDSFYVSVKDYFEELQKFRWPASAHPIAAAGAMDPIPDDQWVPERNLTKEREHLFTSFTSRFRSTEQPTRLLFENTVRFIKEHPEVPICLVLLPTNTKNLDYFGRDSKAIVADLSEMFKEVPEGSGVDLQYLNDTPKIFWDPMHLTAYGKLRVMKEIMKTPCGRKVIPQ